MYELRIYILRTVEALEQYATVHRPRHCAPPHPEPAPSVSPPTGSGPNTMLTRTDYSP
jgi:hypothetical protein